MSYDGSEVRDLGGVLRVTAQDYLQALAEGDIPTHEAWSKLGFCDNIPASEVLLWQPAVAYVWPAAAAAVEVVSSSANDTAAGTGIRTVRISYLDGSYAEKSTIVTLNGLTAVSTATGTPAASDVFRVQNVRAATCGSGYAAAGNISVRQIGAPASVYGYIQAGHTRGRAPAWTVPAGKTLYIVSAMVSGIAASANKYIRLTIRATYDDKTGSLLTPGLFFMAFGEVVFASATQFIEFKVPIKLPATADLKVDAYTNSAGGSANVALRGWVE